MSDQSTPRNEDILDLDALVPPVKQVILDGQVRIINPPTMEMFLKVTRLHNRKQRGQFDMSDEEAEIDEAIELITLACPDIKRERIVEMTPNQVTSLTDKIKELMDFGIGENDVPLAEETQEQPSSD